MPTATGHPNMRSGIEKNTLNPATATPAAAARVKSHVGAGGAAAMALISSSSEGGGR
jgi:hypothetical protein